MTYDFSKLSSQDFEELVCDLLEAEWDIRLESFTVGRDKGIDLRCLSGQDAPVIIQCKHRPAANFRRLHSDMLRKELPKIKKLKPKRYVIVTSVGLTPANKEQLLDALSPFVAGTDDILGRTEVNSLVRRHSDVELKNYKLWLTSTAVMTRVLHNAQQCQTDFEVERVIGRLPIFVQNNAFPRAQEILERNQVVVISGAPGIGKTTLADLLLYAHLEQGFKPVVIREGLADARRMFERNSKQIFYFDDFLGQTFLHDRPDMIGANQDAALVAFMEAVCNTKYSRFILTTREHILKTALSFSERLSRSSIMDHHCLLVMDDYSVRQRARIFYNHLYFGDIPDTYKREILKDDFFLQVIKHPNFNPRLIEWLSGYSRIRKVPPESYQSHILGLLNNPQIIWEYAFSNQLSEAARNVLLALVSLGGNSELIDLEPVWKALHELKAKRHNIKTSEGDFRQALNDLEDAFIKIDRSMIELLNPSIRDFIQNILLKGDEVEGLIESAMRFRQLRYLCLLSERTQSSRLKELASVENGDFLEALERLLIVPDLRWDRIRSRSVGTYIDISLENRLVWLIQLLEKFRSSTVLKVVEKLYEYFVDGWKTRQVSVDPVELIEVLKQLDRSPWFKKIGGDKMHSHILEVLLSDMRWARFWEWEAVLSYEKDHGKLTRAQEKLLDDAIREYQTQGAEEELNSCDNENEISEFHDGVEALEQKYGLTLSSVRESAIERLAAYEGHYDHREARHWHRGSVSSVSTHERVDDEELRNLFRNLV